MKRGAQLGNKNGFKKGDKFWLGKKRDDKTKEKISQKLRKGIEIGYRAIHLWIERNYGKPTTCEHCQTGNLTGHEIHWANISGKYRKDRTDWLRICTKCHGLFDKIKRKKTC